jgi:molybdenum cofactor synthesis domain-containing protein
VRIEVVAVGTELLLGQIADTNSMWLGEQMAAAGVDSHFHQAVGDNHTRIVGALRTALARADGVIVCGGLGPTQDDITRDAIAEVMNVALERDEEMVRPSPPSSRHAGARCRPTTRARPTYRRGRRSSPRRAAPRRASSARSATR